MPRPSNTDQRRAQIIQALLEVMSERGYDGASMQDIEEATGLNKQSLYRRWGGFRETGDPLGDRHDERQLEGHD